MTVRATKQWILPHNLVKLHMPLTDDVGGIWRPKKCITSWEDSEALI